MKIKMLCSLLVLSSLGCWAPAPAPESSVSSVAVSSISEGSAGTGPRCVQVRASTGPVTCHGNGCLINYKAGTYLATATHVLKGGELSIWSDGQPIACVFGERMVYDDLTLIKVKCPYRGWPCGGSVQLGDTITSYGKSDPFEPAKALTGTINNMSITSTMPVESGISGSPIFKGDRIVGITTSIVNWTKEGRTFSGGGHILIPE